MADPSPTREPKEIIAPSMRALNAAMRVRLALPLNIDDLWIPARVWPHLQGAAVREVADFVVLKWLSGELQRRLDA